MKKPSTSQSGPARRTFGEGGFFNLRVLIGLFVILAGVFVALAGFGVAQAQQNYRIVTNALDSLVPPLFTVPGFTNWASTGKKTCGLAPS